MIVVPFSSESETDYNGKNHSTWNALHKTNINCTIRISSSYMRADRMHEVLSPYLVFRFDIYILASQFLPHCILKF